MELLLFAVAGYAAIWLMGFLGDAFSNPVDTGYQDRVTRQYIDREQRGEKQPVGLYFGRAYLDQWKREKGE